MTNNEKLCKYQAELGLNNKQLAELLNVSSHTVTAWKRNPQQVSRRNVPKIYLLVLQLEIANRAAMDEGLPALLRPQTD